MLRKFLVVLGSILLFSILWEHVATYVVVTTFKPTTAIIFIAKMIGKITHSIGYLWGKMGTWIYNLKNILRYLYLDKLFFNTIPDFICALWDLVYVPLCEFVNGYWDVLEEYSELAKPWLIRLGSVLILVASCFLVYYFKLYKKAVPFAKKVYAFFSKKILSKMTKQNNTTYHPDQEDDTKEE